MTNYFSNLTRYGLFPAKHRPLPARLLYIVSGQGEFRSASSPAAPVKAGTVVMLFPDEWHTYAPDPETGWEEWWVGFRGENIDRRVAEGFFSPKTPLLHIGHSAGIVSCYQ